MHDKVKADGRMPKAASLSFRAAKPVVWVACLAPLAWLVYRAVFGGLSPNPIDDITDETGQWTLRLLLVSLAVTPVRRLTGWNGIIQWRRLLGLFAFFYGCLHLSTYVVLDQFFDAQAIVADIGKRRYITVGVAGFVILLTLAITSTTGWIRTLGRRWQQLHRLVYVAAVCGVIHLLWIVKGDDLREPAAYGSVLAVLLGVRVYYWGRSRAGRRGLARSRSASPAPASTSSPGSGTSVSDASK